jgi:two-component system, OmpR family, response regulator
VTQRPPRILIVEDDAAVRDSVVAALRSDGHVVHAEADGIGIRSVAEQFRPALAVLDVRAVEGFKANRQ